MKLPPLRILTIRASDSDPDGHARYTDFYLHVHVDDVNDNTPEFADSLVTVLVPRRCQWVRKDGLLVNV